MSLDRCSSLCPYEEALQCQGKEGHEEIHYFDGIGWTGDEEKLPTAMPGREFRVTWQREGQQPKRAYYQTEKGARACAERQRSAAEEMDWLASPLPPIIQGPFIETAQGGGLEWPRASCRLQHRGSGMRRRIVRTRRVA